MEQAVHVTETSRILIVEDESSLREIAVAILSRGGYECHCACTVAEGRQIFEKGRFACALVDLGLPDGHGKDLIAQYAKEDPLLVSIVLTGNQSAAAIIDSMRAGAFDYLIKPVDAVTLKTAVGRAVAHYSVKLERAELFRLLYEEREQLRSRVDAATADIRQYAAACECSNSRLRSLLHLTQVSARSYSEETLIRRVFGEVREHLPVRGIIVSNPSARQVFMLYIQEPELEEPVFLEGETLTDGSECNAFIVEAESAEVFQDWVKQHTRMDTDTLALLVFTQQFWNQPSCAIGFFLEKQVNPNSSDREFLDMCAYLLVLEWERSKLLFHVAHQASLGNIAVELVRNFIQPLTAIRTAADFLEETIVDEDSSQGVLVIRENVERLHLQTQEFRKLAFVRPDSVATVRLEEYVSRAVDLLSVAIRSRNVQVIMDIQSPGECVLLNGTALARTFLDLILGALRAVEVGGHVWITLREMDAEHVAFELRHDGPRRGVFMDSITSMVAASVPGEKAQVELQFAERTVHSCGGSLSVELDDSGSGILRIVLPSNATRFAPVERKT